MKQSLSNHNITLHRTRKKAWEMKCGDGIKISDEIKCLDE